MSRPPTRASTVVSRAASRTTSRTAYRTIDSDESQWIFAVVEGKNREIGAVAIEQASARVTATQYPDTPTFVRTLHLLATKPPITVIVPSTALCRDTKRKQPAPALLDQASLLVRSIRDAWPDVAIHGTDRSTWEEQKGYEYICRLITRDNERIATINAVKSKYYTLAAASALFVWLEQANSIVFVPRSVRIHYGPLEGTCLLDKETVQHLELASNALNRLSKQSLFGLLNTCVTPMGSRLLRANILGPLTDVDAINGRLDAVEELVGSDDRFQTVKKALVPLKGIDLDQMVYQIVSPKTSPSPSELPKESETKVARLLALRQVLRAMPTLRTSLAHAESSLLTSVHVLLSDERLDDMIAIIDETINDEAVSSGQKGPMATRNARLYAVKADRRLLLEVARQTYKDNLDDAFNLYENLSKEHDQINFNMRYTQTGFIFDANSVELEGKHLPPVFINVSKSGKKTTFTCLDLKKKNARLLDSVQEIFMQSHALLDGVFDEIRGSIASLFRCAEAIALLDMLVALADLSANNSFVRPEFTRTLAIKSGRHPLVERFRLADGAFVPNDTYADDSSSFQIITGANMSGKSTLLRQIATLHILAQVGCFVPAEYASFRIVDAIFARLSNDDCIEANLSTFAQEMTTMAAILSALGTYKQPLVIVDELGRGTAPSEGVGIAHAIAEQILQTKAFCFFATHFKVLSNTLGRYPNVVTLHLDAEIDTSASEFSMTFHHRLKDGLNPLEHYGLELAKGVRLPADIVPRAKAISDRLQELSEKRKDGKDQDCRIERCKLLRQVKAQVAQLVEAQGLSGDELKEALTSLVVQIED